MSRLEKTSIFRYCHEGNLEKVKELVEKNPDIIYEKNVYEDIALSRSISVGHLHIIEYLLNVQKSLYNITVTFGRTILSHTIANCKLNIKCKVFDLILNHLMKTSTEQMIVKYLNMKDKTGLTSLHYACIYKFRYGLERILNSGCDVNIQDRIMKTPFMYSCSLGNIDACKLLLQSKCVIQKLNNMKNTCLYYAVLSKNTEVVKLVLNHKNIYSILDLKNSRGYTVLEHFSKSTNSISYIKVIKLLLNKHPKITFLLNDLKEPVKKVILKYVRTILNLKWTPKTHFAKSRLTRSIKNSVCSSSIEDDKFRKIVRFIYCSTYHPNTSSYSNPEFVKDIVDYLL